MYRLFEYTFIIIDFSEMWTAFPIVKENFGATWCNRKCIAWTLWTLKT